MNWTAATAESQGLITVLRYQRLAQQRLSKHATVANVAAVFAKDAGKKGNTFVQMISLKQRDRQWFTWKTSTMTFSMFFLPPGFNWTKLHFGKENQSYKSFINRVTNLWPNINMSRIWNQTNVSVTGLCSDYYRAELSELGQKICSSHWWETDNRLITLYLHIIYIFIYFMCCL